MSTVAVFEPEAQTTMAIEDRVERDEPYVVAMMGNYTSTDGGGGQHTYGHS